MEIKKKVNCEHTLTKLFYVRRINKKIRWFKTVYSICIKCGEAFKQKTEKL